MDCSLNGACNDQGACECDKGWTGDTCEILKLDTTPKVVYGHGASNSSSWGGGPPVYDGTKYHLYVTEIAAGCGMCTWARMSTIAHTVADRPEGPYQKVGVAVGTQAHNAYYTYSPSDKMHLLYHIGGGDNPDSCNPYFQGCEGGITPNCTGIRPPHGWPAPSCPSNSVTHIHYSKSLDGPWTSAGSINVTTKKLPFDAGTSNPAPYVFPNGTTLMVARGKDAGRFPNGTRQVYHNIFLYRAQHWSEGYSWVPLAGVNGSVPVGNGKVLTEDPVLYRGRRGFHLLLHSAPDLTHGWSPDGLQWGWSSKLIGPPHPSANNERPRVVLDENGDLDWVFVSQEIGPGDASRTVGFSALQ